MPGSSSAIEFLQNTGMSCEIDRVFNIIFYFSSYFKEGYLFITSRIFPFFSPLMDGRGTKGEGASSLQYLLLPQCPLQRRLHFHLAELLDGEVLCSSASAFSSG
jgi:hypothetical protein